MAVLRTEFLVLVLVLVTKTNCDSEVRDQNDTDDIRTDAIRDKVQIPMDTIAADMLLRGSNVDDEVRYKDIEPERSYHNIRDYEKNFENETDTDTVEMRMTTVEEMTTTEAPEDVNENLDVEEEEPNKNTEADDKSDDKNDDDAVVAATEQIETEGIDNDVIKARTDVPDVFTSDNRSIYEPPKTETTSQPTTRSMDEVEDLVPRIAELGDDLEITGQRNPKTDNSDPKPPIDKRNFETPHPPPVVSKSSTLKSWLEDAWSRPPAGLLVPLRPAALGRALALWNDLTANALNVSDIVIVGYDSNGINWRSRHNLQPSSTGSGERAVAEALSKLLLKYQGVNSDSTNDGTMRALASAAKLVPYDSALFVVTDKGAGDPQRLPLALRALVEKRLKVYIIWTESNTISPEQEEELQELRNVSRHTQGDVLPYSLQTMDMESGSNLASEAELQEWDPMEVMAQARRGRVHSQLDAEKFETLLVRRGGGEALSLGVPVENGVSALRVYIEGAVEHAVLYPPNDGPQIDLYNISSVSAFSPSSRTEGLTPRDVLLVFPGANLETDMLSVLPATPPKSDSAMVGVWHLSVRCDTCDYRLCVGARAQLRFNVEEKEQPDSLKFRITGPVASVRESVLIDEYGMELAKLPYSYPPMTRDPEDNADSQGTELIADVQLPDVKGSRVYAKIVGRDVKGEPFVRLGGPLVHQSEVRTGRAAALLSAEPRNDLELAEEANSRVYNERLEFNDSNVLPNNRAVSQVVNQRGSLLTTVQIGLSSRLYGAPGTNLQLHFEVTNYREQTVFFRFGAVGELKFLRDINPLQQNVAPGQTVNVIVNVGITRGTQPGARELVTFTAFGQEQLSISAYVYVINPNEPLVDTWPPQVRHTFQGSCIGRMGDDCAQHVWSATIAARDSPAGLLRLTSSPIGLAYDSNFISGSREEVLAVYRATCCAPRLMVTAVDALGNTNSYPVDISNYITEAGIAAISLGVILGLALLIFIILMIIFCVRRRRENRELPSSYTSSRNMS